MPFLAVQTRVRDSSIPTPVTHSLTHYKEVLLFDIKEQPKRLVTFETYDQSDYETWPEQKKYHYKDKYKDIDNDKDKYI